MDRGHGHFVETQLSTLAASQVLDAALTHFHGRFTQSKGTYMSYAQISAIMHQAR